MSMISESECNVCPYPLQTTKPSHKSHNAFHKYPTMHHFVTEMCTFLLQNGALWDMGLVHHDMGFVQPWGPLESECKSIPTPSKQKLECMIGERV